LHIGHAKSICLNFGIAAQYGGKCNLRFDDTNPAAEDTEYVESIIRDVSWLGFEWNGAPLYASSYYEQLYQHAEQLIQRGKAYVDDLTVDEIREYRGTSKGAGRESPHRNRSVEENLDLFRRMRAGDFEDGARTLRARIDMSSGNLHLRDPIMYRIRRQRHHRTGDEWCIYPMYDWAHGISDSIEGISHSICTLEFEDHRPLYDWFLEALDVYRPRQIEFARLNLTYTLTSKRKLHALIEKGIVRGWDDPRMPTLSGLRRRGLTPESIRDFCDRIGVAKNNSTVDVQLLDHCVREDLNTKANRVMAVLDPLRLVIVNYPEGQMEEVEAVNNPEDASAGVRPLPFSGVLFIERDDFVKDPPKKWFRLAPGAEVRLKHAYLVRCEEVIEDAAGHVIEVRCSYDPGSRGGEAPDGRKVRGTLHWVSAAHAVDAEVRLYDRLFNSENPGAEETLESSLNPNSLQILAGCKVEQSLAPASVGQRFQFLRHGYFTVDPDSTDTLRVFNRIVGLKDSWAKIAQKGE
jgi:glutaminyl-tRNA synthetase